jgi:hypothetical protein
VTAPTAGSAFLLRESDFTILEPGDNWFWEPLKPFLNASVILEQFNAKYEQGASLILNVPPNSTGAIPAEYVAQLRAFAAARAATFGAPAAALGAPVSGACAGLSFTVPVSGPFDTLLTVEDLSRGQVIGGYSVEARDAASGAWAPLRVRGVTVGTRVLDSVGPQAGKDALRWNCTADLNPAPPVHFVNAAGDCLGPPAGATTSRCDARPSARPSVGAPPPAAASAASARIAASAGAQDTTLGSAQAATGGE